MQVPLAFTHFRGQMTEDRGQISQVAHSAADITAFRLLSSVI